MKLEIIDHEIFRNINPLDIEKYLFITGWERVRHISGEVSVWDIVSQNKKHHVWVPLHREYGDFSESIKRVIKTISLVEERSQLELVEDFSTVSVGDVIRLRSYDQLDRSSSSLPFDDGLLLIKKGRDMLNAAAHSVREKRAVHPSQRPKPILDYLKKLRLGQTEHGSYVVKLVSPIPYWKRKQLSLNLMDASIPFERKVTVSLMNSLNYLNMVAKDTFKRGHFYFEAFQELVSEGISANLCEAVTNGENEKQKRQPLGVSVTWSYVLQDLFKHDVPTEIEFSPNVMPYIEEAAIFFREKNPEKMVLQGYVVVLKRGKVMELGEITLVSIIEKRQKNVRISLDRDAYSMALYAHDNELKISVEGELIKKGRLTYLEKPKKIHLVEQHF